MKQDNQQVAHYLQSRQWDTTTLTNTQLEIILGASCLLYWGGLTSLAFVLGLSEAIQDTYYQHLSPELKEATILLSVLKEKLALHPDTETIKKLVAEAQQKITGIAIV